MKYKVQIPSAWGQWGDLRCSADTEEYVTELFDTESEARLEASLIEGSRVVTEDTEEDINLYD